MHDTELDTGFFKGTSADQDRRFSDKELKLLKTMKFPPEFDKKVRTSHVFQTYFRVFTFDCAGRYAQGQLDRHTTMDRQEGRRTRGLRGRGRR